MLSHPAKVVAERERQGRKIDDCYKSDEVGFGS
jgi:hypothetical protein